MEIWPPGLDAFLIHSADPQTRQTRQTLLKTHVIRPSVPTFQNRAKQKQQDMCHE